MTVRDAVRAGASRLGAAGSETARLDAELLLAHTLRAGRIDLYTEFERPLSTAEQAAFDALLARRERLEPIAYILGEWGFRRLTLAVDQRALIPRSETEVVVERCLALLDGRTGADVLDVGTGTGAIALAIADEHPDAHVTAVDESADALALARENAGRTGLAVTFRQQDVTADFPPGPWDIVVSNPPYIDPDELATVMPDVRDWEPRSALIGPGTTEAVARGAAATLRAGGAVVLEVGAGQASTVAALLDDLGFAAVRTTADLAGHGRVVEGRR